MHKPLLISFFAFITFITGLTSSFPHSHPHSFSGPPQRGAPHQQTHYCASPQEGGLCNCTRMAANWSPLGDGGGHSEEFQSHRVTRPEAVLPGDVWVLAAGIKGNRGIPSHMVHCLVRSGWLPRSWCSRWHWEGVVGGETSEEVELSLRW